MAAGKGARENLLSLDRGREKEKIVEKEFANRSERMEKSEDEEKQKERVGRSVRRRNIEKKKG